MAEISAARVTHLGMIQSVIARMAGESARMKQFALAALGALAATSEATGSSLLAYIASALTVIFWLLDAQYLAQERWYRQLYDQVREAQVPADFSMTPGEEIRARCTVATTAFGWSVAPLYGVLLILSLFLAQVVG